MLFEALSDPTRRSILEILLRGEATAGDLAAAFEVTRPAVSRHLRVLREAGLVTARVDAQRRVYRLEPEPLRELDRWLERYRRFWSGRLDELGEHLQRRKREGRAARRRKR